MPSPLALFGRLSADRVLAESSASVLYEARTEGHLQTVIIKTARTGADWSAVMSVKREIVVLERLQHPGIVSLLEHGEANGVPWYAMERVEGGTLAEYLSALWQHGGSVAAAGQLSEVLTLMSQLCAALGHLHREGIVHQDLKPTNVSLRPGSPPQPVLLDFGSSSHTVALDSREVADFRLPGGTPGYSAPEVLSHEATIDSRADLYSVGCLLFEAVTGRPAFESEGGSIERLRRQLQTEPPRVSSLVSGVPPSVDELICRLLSKHPGDRVATAEEVSALLEAAHGVQAVGPVARPALLFRPALVGRDEVLERFDRVLRDAAAGHGRVCLVRGESGIGKTTLARELARRASTEFLIVGSEANTSGHTALLPLAAALAQAQGRAAGVLATLGSSSGGPHASPEQLAAALRAGLARLAREQPVLVLFDDLQRSDELTLSFLTSLPEGWLSQHRVVVLGLARSEETTPELERLGARPDVETTNLTRLDDRAQTELIAGALAVERAPLALVSSLVPRAGGNPFFLMEFLRLALSEARVTAPAEALWSAQWSDHFSFPDSLRALVARRLGTLGPEGAELIEWLATLGRTVSTEDLELLPPAVALTLGTALHELLTRHIVEPLAHGGLRFVHDKLCEEAAARIAPARRRELHATLARAAETRAQHRPAFLALHWREAGDETAEFRFVGAAGETCLRGALFTQAAGHFRRALALSAGRDVSEATRAGWHLQLARAEFFAGRVESAEREAVETLRLSGISLGTSTWSWRWLLVRTALTRLASLLPGARWFTAPPSQRPQLANAAAASLLLTQRYFYTDDVAKVVALAFLAASLAERAAVDVPLAHAALASLAGFVRAHGLAQRYFTRARNALKDTDPSEAALVGALEALAAANRGRWGDALAVLKAAEETLCDWDDPHMERMVLTTRGHVEYFSGDHETALRTFEAVLQSAHVDRSQQHAIWARFSMARSLRRLDRIDEAHELLVEAKAGLELVPELQSEIICAGLLSAVQLERGDHVAAEATALAAERAIARAKPTSFVAMEGYVTTALTLIRLGANATGERQRTLLAAARRVMRAHQSLAVLFPLVRATLEFVRGTLALVLHERAQAKRAFRRSSEHAERFVMKADARDAAHQLRGLE